MRDGMLYFIGCPETMRIKIGHATNPYARLSALQTGSPTKLVMLAMHSGTQGYERELHAKFAEHRIHGEWFRMHADIFEHICMTVWLTAANLLALGQEAPRWVRVGLQSMHESEPLPKEMAALI